MGQVQWEIRGPEVTTCNCDFGCPCQFNALPTRGDCRAMVAMRIEEGHFGAVPLAGQRWALLVAWPGPIHEGNGEAQAIVDPEADPAQLDAILKILTGQETMPGATIFNVFAATITTLHEPLRRPITFAADLAAGTAAVRVEGVGELAAEPIRNPITGAPHPVKVILPTGFEYHEAAYASGRARATGAVPQEWSGRHAHLIMMHMTGAGVVH